MLCTLRQTQPAMLGLFFIEMQMLSRGFELPVDGSLCIPAFLAPCKFMMLFVIQIWPLGPAVDPFSAYLICIFSPLFLLKRFLTWKVSADLSMIHLLQLMASNRS